MNPKATLIRPTGCPRFGDHLYQQSSSNNLGSTELTTGKTVKKPEGFIFETVRLSGGISFEVPTTWRVLSKNESDAIVAFSSNALNYDPNSEITLYRANSTPLATYASVGVTASQADTAFPLWAFEAAINENPNEVNAIMQEELQNGLPLINQRMTKYGGVSTQRFGENASYIVEYERTGLKGDVYVKLIRIQHNNIEYSLNFAYRISETAQWENVIKYMESTIRFTEGR